MLQITTINNAVLNVERNIVEDIAIVAECDLHKVARAKRHSAKRPFPKGYRPTGTNRSGGTTGITSDAVCDVDSCRRDHRMSVVVRQSQPQEMPSQLWAALVLSRALAL